MRVSENIEKHEQRSEWSVDRECDVIIVQFGALGNVEFS